MTVEEENYIRELASHYLDDLLKEVNNLEEFIHRRDAVQVRTFGHRMKGTAGTLGFDELYDLGNQIEEEAGARIGRTLGHCERKCGRPSSSIRSWGGS